ncbi:hypothetical protein FAM09_02970 [Niastella caeni]|uniref:Uncharacterized protein n=1 Tax=Niastella caeni TaxID=2569763 RepID=A0A4S8HZS4_9BACT|nr:hypothetical protein [Niastella caeni]THU41095.1 hypothetical protein FAM09_02970 [Niastella caeni]
MASLHLAGTLIKKLSMHHEQLLKILYAPMEELGYKNLDKYTWVLPFDEFSIVSNIVRREEPRFDILMVVVFDLLEKEFPLEKCRQEKLLIETTLYDLLLSLGEPEKNLNKLFYNNFYKGAEFELENNIPAIMDLFKTKIIPFFENWNDYLWLIENFEKRIFKKPFYVIGPDVFLNFFYEQLVFKQWIKENC